MSESHGTYVATAVTTRQVVGVRLAQLAMGAVFFGAAIISIQILMRGPSHVGEAALFLGAWAYISVPPRISVAYPPITLWVGLVMFTVSAGSVAVGAATAVRAARIATQTGPRKQFSLGRASSDREAARTLKHQLRERGRAGLFSGGNVTLGVGLVGVALVLVSAVLAPTSSGGSSSLLQLTGQKGLLPTMCVPASLIAIFGLLLAFPYGPRERVVVDGSGNVRGVGEPVDLPSMALLPEPSTQMTASVTPTNAHFCHQCGSPVSTGERFCRSCGADLALLTTPTAGSPVPTAVPSAPNTSPEPGVAGQGADAPVTSPYGHLSETEPEVMAPATRHPARKGRAATIAFWVVGILLLIVGGLGFGLTALEDDANAVTLATHLTELQGDLTGTGAKAAVLRARTDGLATAMADYTAALDEVRAAHEAMVDGLNRSWAEFTESGSAAIARNEMLPLVDRFQQAVADQQVHQSALASVVALHRAVTP